MEKQDLIKRLPVQIGTFAAALTLAVSVSATNGMGGEMEDMTFEDLDRTGDGVITREEAAEYPELQERFDEFDLTGDGQLTEQEFDIAKRELQQDQEGQPGAAQPGEQPRPGEEERPGEEQHHDDDPWGEETQDDEDDWDTTEDDDDDWGTEDDY